MIYRMDNLTENGINPVTGREYNSSWLIFQLSDSTEWHCHVGSREGSAYTIMVSRVIHKDWKMAAGDFIGYCGAGSLNGLLVISQSEYDEALQRYRGHSFCERKLRSYEPPVLIHSTPADAWEKIQRGGMLKCFNRLKAEHAAGEEEPIGAKLGDPPHFGDYIMFGGGMGGEIVVSSKQQGKIIMDADAKYRTGARLYFDAEKMARDGLLIRDGFHVKVKDSLPLAPYLIWAATWDRVGLADPISTPKVFAAQADREFEKFIRRTGKNPFSQPGLEFKKKLS